jgi:hypothetical protein
MFHIPLRNGEFLVAMFQDVARCCTAMVSKVVSTTFTTGVPFSRPKAPRDSRMPATERHAPQIAPAAGFSVVGAGILDFFGRELSSHVGTCYAFVGTTFGGMPTRQPELPGTKPVTR